MQVCSLHFLSVPFSSFSSHFLNDDVITTQTHRKPMSSSSTATLPPSRTQQQRKKKKKKQLIHHDPKPNHQNADVSKWKSQSQHLLYSSNLLHALSRDVIAPSSSSATCPPPRRVRDAADRVLATAAQGRTRWSRAILASSSYSRLKIKFRRRRNHRRSAGAGKIKRQRFSVSRLKGKGLPAVQRKVRVLGRLVPGCRKESFPVILEEATDYIAALEMQVRAMTRLTQLLSVSTGSG